MSWILHNDFLNKYNFTTCQCVHSETLQQCQNFSYYGMAFCRDHIGIIESYCVPAHIEQIMLKNRR